MYKVSDKFIQALENGVIQHIQGRISPKYGKDFYLDDNNLVGEVSYSRQCTSNESEFGIGQLYAGTAQITVNSEEFDRVNLRGGTLRMKWRIDNFDWIPLGEWTITNPQRISKHLISITATDCIGMLDVTINDNFVGAITLEARMNKVTELTGVEFAQTANEIKELIGCGNTIFGSSFCSTCRAEVTAIAEFMGGFAFADRENRIKFRKIGTEPVLEIPAELRHNIKLNEYTFGIRGVAYCDEYGYTSVKEIEGGNVNTPAVPIITDNPYIWDYRFENQSDTDRQYRGFLKYAAENLSVPDWTPGEIEYYGNPALELGDFVEVSGGINGAESTLFLITAEHWQFRGPHTLISAGAVENIVSCNGNSGIPTNQQISASINITKNISVIDFECTGEMSGIIASGKFSVREQTAVFADITLNLRGLSDSEIRINLLLDGIEQPVYFSGKITENEPLTAHFSSYKIVEVGNGIHNADLKISGDCEILQISAYIWGQNISEIQPEPTFASDYEYSISDESVTIKKYIGSAVNIAIPLKIEGLPVKKIGSGAFSETEVESVKIPEGVTEIV
ncbi:MAG: hypothetical protein K2G83_04280 [Ruminococcus sp.]|nr:hypothetical protein [Ruminococcus sp.]